ncbi:J domain-containing protein [Lyngbya confervoides]|uniref:DnaJ domain-containing protein n=1 Tax=Lyngbya confervoides BDU141951 TaxID=1574623 RepID=A0ABD4T925_9CYAN|nr:DnaJ domain-containing protein [Lyngbya confervoides]MCM1984990.1 DnaJ domain-containing protein [Lyngbya confervoides BDU141951]
MTDSPDYYQVLGVARTATQGTIKQAFRQLARRYHPDLNPHNPKAEAAFKLIQQAYDVLGDRRERQLYDRLQTFSNPSPAWRSETMDSSQDRTALADCQRIYSLGIQLASQRKYQLANQRFTQAIELKPTFVEAYMGRCQVRYVLGDDRGVLEDCNQILQLQAKVPQAHYYQGRARHRLNSVEHAIQSYSKAIHLDENYAAAYFYRGLAQADLQAYPAALSDLTLASQLYRSMGNQQGVERAESQLKRLRQQSSTSPIPEFKGWRSLVGLLINPTGMLQPVFDSLSSPQATQLGLGMGALAILAFSVGLNVLWPPFLQLTNPWQSLFLGGLAFLVLVVVSGLGSILFGNRGGNWSGDIYLSGLTLMPIGLGFLLASPMIQVFGQRGLGSLVLMICALSTLIFYSGLTQLNRLTEPQATGTALVALLLGSWATETVYRLLIAESISRFMTRLMTLAGGG